jgi:hypothetical protein
LITRIIKLTKEEVRKKTRFCPKFTGGFKEMKRNSIIVFIALLVFSAGLNAASKRTNFTMTANVSGSLSFSVVLSNAASPTIINFGGIVAGANVPIIATNAGKPTCAKIVYNHNYPSWQIKAYTANKDAGATPRYVGIDPGKYGTVDDGTGMIIDNGSGTNVHSSPIKIWANTKMPDGTLALAPTPYWVGLGTLYGVPKPTSETKYPWIATNFNGINGATEAITNGFTEAAAGIDVNGDGDLLDVVDGSTNNSWSVAPGSVNHLRKVFEYSCWQAVTMDSVVVPGAATPILFSDVLAYGVTSGSFKVYFAMTDDVAGVLKTNKLYFELLTQ